MGTAKEAWAAKADRLEAWADKAAATAAAIFASRPAYARDPAFMTQPARSSRGVARARAKLNDREVRAWELQAKAKAHREKAAELRRMATTNAGDAEARKTAYRAALDSIIDARNVRGQHLRRPARREGQHQEPTPRWRPWPRHHRQDALQGCSQALRYLRRLEKWRVLVGRPSRRRPNQGLGRRHSS